MTKALMEPTGSIYIDGNATLICNVRTKRERKQEPLLLLKATINVETLLTTDALVHLLAMYSNELDALDSILWAPDATPRHPAWGELRVLTQMRNHLIRLEPLPDSKLERHYVEAIGTLRGWRLTPCYPNRIAAKFDVVIDGLNEVQIGRLIMWQSETLALRAGPLNSDISTIMDFQTNDRA